jgi:hypothetical protein
VAILFTAVVATQPVESGLLLRASTTKSLNEFGTCFTRAQDQAARPWAFMPTRSGGTFSNAGAQGVASPYWLRVSEGKPLNEIRLFAAQASASKVWDAVVRCQ